MDENVLTIISDKERAAQIVATITELVKPILALLNEAARSDLEVQFNIGLDMYGRSQLNQLRVLKRL